MKYRQLGNTGLMVSAIGFGGWAIGGPVDLYGLPVGWSGVNDNDARAAIRRALDLGINLFDTADVYGSGHSEELLGELLQGKDCVVATKAGNARKEGRGVKDFSEQHLRRQLESSLSRLKRETVDIFQLHNPPSEVWQHDEAFTLLDKLKQEGKIRFCGVSISTMEEGIHLINAKKVDVLQVLFNILNQAPADELLPLAGKQGVGILARVPLASGLLTGKFSSEHVFDYDDNRRNYLTPRRLAEALSKVERLRQLIADTGCTTQQVALAFLRQFDLVPIPGAKNVQQLEQNVASLQIEIDESLFSSIRKEFRNYNFFLRYKVHV